MKTLMIISATTLIALATPAFAQSNTHPNDLQENTGKQGNGLSGNRQPTSPSGQNANGMTEGRSSSTDTTDKQGNGLSGSRQPTGNNSGNVNNGN